MNEKLSSKSIVEISNDGMITPRRTTDQSGYSSEEPVAKGVFIVPAPLSADASTDIPCEAVASISGAEAAGKSEGGVYYFTDLAILRCCRAYPELTIGVMTVIEGYPSSLYDHDFRDATFDLKSVSYNELLLDISSARRASEALAADMRSAPEQRDIDTTRASGYQKIFDRFETTGKPGAKTFSDEVVDSDE